MESSAATTAVEVPKMERRSSAPVKRRVSRACDHCHRMRTRCNGQSPCSRCIELEYVCQYNREKKRRGKVRNVFIPMLNLPGCAVCQPATTFECPEEYLPLRSHNAETFVSIGTQTHSEATGGRCRRAQPTDTWTCARQRLF
jgi:hypothetical protein